MIRILAVSAFIFAVLVAALAWYLRNPTLGYTPMAGMKVEADRHRLKAHVEFLSGMNPGRHFDSPESMNAVRDYIKQSFEEAGFKTELQEVPSRGNVYHNVIARYGPMGGPIVVIGAHYDVHGEDNPGADDNASGVAGLLELARLLKSNNPNYPFGIELVAYTLEEPPYFASEGMGSAIHADELKDAEADVRLMFSLEMIGYFSDETFSQKYPVGLLYLFYPWAGDFIAIVGNQDHRDVVKYLKWSFVRYIKTYSINAPPFLQGIDFSDHRNYWKHGWPAVMVTDTAFYRNDQYHKPGDTPDRLDYEKMSQVVNAVYNSVHHLDKWLIKE